MDREIPIGNRYIDKKMQSLRDQKHRQTLSQIRKKNQSVYTESSSNDFGKNSRFNSWAVESNLEINADKNLQIQKQNILLFNKIASIIRDKPKGNVNKFFGQNMQNSAQKIKKVQERLKTENNLFQKRISQQKPTIQNKLFYKDRIKNVKYLKFIGRYPYENQRRNENLDHLQNNQSMRSIRSYSSSQMPVDQEVFHKKTEEFDVKITKISDAYYVFSVEVDGNEKNYQYTMNKPTFDDQLTKNGYNYEQLVKKLRLAKNQKMIFDYL